MRPVKCCLALALFSSCALCISLRSFYRSRWGPGYLEPLLHPTRIPIVSAPPALAASLFHYNITPRLAWRTTRLLLLVISAPHEHRRRRRIRHSWGHRARLEEISAAVVFVVGASKDPEVFRSYQREAAEFGDLLFDNKLTDSYANLTRKVLSALYWTSTQPWSRLRFVAKVDSDNFVTMATMGSTTLLLDPNKPEIVGRIHKGTQPYRQSNHKWFMSRAQYPFDFNPDYCSGQGYMMTVPALRLLVCFETLLDLQKGRFLPYEDLFITGILRQRLGIQLKHKYWIDWNKNRPEFVQ